MLVNVITGYSASMRQSKKTVTGFVTDIFRETVTKNIDRYDCYSSDRHCIDNSARFLVTGNSNNMLLIGKSMGAVRSWWLLNEYWLSIKNKLVSRQGGRLGVVLIDPHGWQKGDGRVGSYGVKLGSLKYDKCWARDDLKFVVFHQKKHYPRGVGLEAGGNNVNNIELTGQDASHWSVTDINSKTGRMVADRIKDMIKWVQRD